MNLLALETSTQNLSVALWRDGACLERTALIPGGGSERLLPWVRELLDEAGLGLPALEGIAFGAGPGSFTGVRLACGVAQGLACGLDLPVVAVSTLEALAFNGRAACPQAARVLACLDARMNEVYYAAYDLHEGGLRLIHGPRVTPPESLALQMFETGMLAEGSWLGCGDGFATYPDLLADHLPVGMRQSAIIPNAVAVAHLAAPRLMRGEGCAAEHAVPLYVRDKVALTTAERLARGGVK
ncbi:MAG: tRNA (adenosine(37)-N6)-threonylcarbamoyltransferase complex dimerization subunit type 1 TsaB [Sterolibacterium sp.]|nr:tRNA (adenosine(37)-N6)-threonylcarbamoyltransferase complex dimerization subunit type 1 TsaB [Sterolibacterium sp.]